MTDLQTDLAAVLGLVGKADAADAAHSAALKIAKETGERHHWDAYQEETIDHVCARRAAFAAAVNFLRQHGPAIAALEQRLAAIDAGEAMAAEEAREGQNWAGMDGAIAWHLIDRHADNWNEVGAMMNAWLAANAAIDAAMGGG